MHVEFDKQQQKKEQFLKLRDQTHVGVENFE